MIITKYINGEAKDIIPQLLNVKATSYGNFPISTWFIIKSLAMDDVAQKVDIIVDYFNIVDGETSQRELTDSFFYKSDVAAYLIGDFSGSNIG